MSDEYYQVTFLPVGGKRKVTQFGRLLGRKNGVITFRRVHKNGEDYDEGSTAEIDRVHMFMVTEESAVMKKMRWNLHYGELELIEDTCSDCGHSWHQHKPLPNGAWGCAHFGCGCRDVVRPEEIDTSDIPEVSPKWFKKAKLKIPGKN